MYTIEYIKKKTTLKKLLEFFDVEKVNKDCVNCPNYKRIWSCPPHNFNTYGYVCQYSHVELYLAKINLDIETVTKEDMKNIFEKERRIFSDKLLEMENEISMAVIAGNCYMCKTCMRPKGRACILKDKMRYSLESLGFKVGEIAEFAGVELKWSDDKIIAPYLVTIGAIFKK